MYVLEVALIFFKKTLQKDKNLSNLLFADWGILQHAEERPTILHV